MLTPIQLDSAQSSFPLSVSKSGIDQCAFYQLDVRPRSLVIPEDGLNRGSLLKQLFRLLGDSVQTLTCVSPTIGSRSGWQELHNKLHAFAVFKEFDWSVDATQTPHVTRLLRLLADLARFEKYEAVWAVEGIGYLYGGCAREPFALNYLGWRDPHLPVSALIPLHTGMGLSLAESVLPSIEAAPRPALAEFERLCRVNSHEGYFGACYEALGLATYGLHPGLLSQVDRNLASTNAALRRLFWHGVGRGIYFSPRNLLPYRAAPWQGLRHAFQKSPDVIAFRNAVAGFSWALTLVNIQHPEIIASFMRHHFNEQATQDACRNGIRSALVAWCSMTDGQVPNALVRYRPALSESGTWRELILRSCDQCFADFEALRSGPGVDELFRFRAE